MKHIVVSAILGLVLAAGVATSAAAQDLTLGYQFQRLSEDEQHRNMPTGFSIDGSFPLGGNISAVGQFDWTRKTETQGNEAQSLTLFGAAGGVRWAMAGQKVSPFVQGTLGVVHHKSEDNDGEETGDNFAWGIDGGVAIPISGKVSAVGEIGYRWLKDDEPIHLLRVIAGIRINL